MVLTNKTNIPLGLAVMLAYDEYDYQDNPKYISATSIMKPLKQIVLSKRVDPNTTVDIESFIAMRNGSAIHSAIEEAWKKGHKRAMKALGYPDKLIERIRINPSKEELESDDSILPVWIEQRNMKELNGMIIGGKFDMVIEGEVRDFKTTSTYTYMTGSHDEDYKLQGSIYRWLNPDKIKKDTIEINFVFTDWSAKQALIDPKYPKSRVAFKKIPLYSIHDIENYLTTKIRKIQENLNKPEEDLPRCTDEELWRTEGKYKYYSNPDNLARATKVFDTLAEASMYKTSKGKGVVIYVPGEVRRCKYCSASSICKQCKEYFPDGLN